MIEARALTHRFGTTTVLSDVSLSVKAGEVVALVGPNGAGKTTLLRILAGEIEPASGEVTLAGRSSRGWTRERRGAPRAILTPEAGAVPYSCHEVVLLGRTTRVDRRQSAKDRAVARLAMAATDTRVYEDRPYPTLSRGERHRVQAGRTLAQIWDEPDLRAVLFDEPTASLDLAQQHGMLRLARRMAEARCAVVCVTHDLNLAAQYATSIVVLHRGRIHAAGTPQRVLSSSLLADVFAVDALVVPHPELPCPFVVTRGPVERRHPSIGRMRTVMPPPSGRLPGGLL